MLSVSHFFSASLALALAVAVSRLLPIVAVAVTVQWQVESSGCFNETDAVSCQKVQSLIECLSVSVNVGLFAQWQSSVSVCCSFRHHRLCRLRSASACECTMYTRVTHLLHFLQSLSHKLVGVWVTGGGNEFSNLVFDTSCDVTTPQFISNNIEWSAEGATFNGVNSYMLLNNTQVMNSSSGLTFAIRVRRQPGIQPFMEAANCSDLTNHGPHMWELDSPTKLYGGTTMITPNIFGLTSVTGTLPNNSSAWINIAFTVDAVSGEAHLFVGDSFLPDSLVTRTNFSIGKVTSVKCLLIGHRWLSTGWLNGTVNAIAVAKTPMTESDIRRLFQLLPLQTDI